MKLFKYLCIAAIAVLSISSCMKDAPSFGKVNYSLGASAVKTSDLKGWSGIEDAFKTELLKLGGTTSHSNTNFELEGNYKELDAKVIAACKTADAKCVENGITLEDGYVTMQVTALYFASAESKVLFEKTYGNKSDL